ncbi:MAG: GGDEF domain-containing protein [Betaproteobacteria bacterium]|nr:GGDEF domain-containing protein [Betaproteobacteria bacterium]
MSTATADITGSRRATAPGAPGITEIARETIRQLALRKLVPTPENYARLWREVGGEPPAGANLQERDKPRAANADAASLRDLPTYTWAATLEDMLRLLDANLPGMTPSRKRASLRRVLTRFGRDPEVLREKLRRVLDSWGAAVPHAETDGPAPLPPAATALRDARQPAPIESERDVARYLRELLAGTIGYAVSERLGYSPEQIAEAGKLSAALSGPCGREELAELGGKLKKFWLQLELHGAGQQEVITGLVLLLQLLLSNIAELTEDDRWLKGQIERLRDLMRSPIDAAALVEAERSMREVIFRQGTLKSSLDDAKQALKTMLTSFIDRLCVMTEHTGDFQGRIEGYASRIEETEDIGRLSQLVADLLKDTRGMQADIVRSRDDLNAARDRAETYASKVRELESQLEEVSGLVREDHLTSALNRRGLGEAFDTEMARRERSGKPLSIAVLDVDNFKAFNDKLGHQAGDSALVHLVNVVREAIRPTDQLGRYGGEEFVVLLPETGIEEAELVTTRVQRALTRRFFLHNNDRLLITFSAGIAEVGGDEDWERAMGRADSALLEAKRLGKNRVVIANPPAA